MTGSLWFSSKDEATNFNNYIANTNNLSLSYIELNYQEIQLQMEQTET